VTVLIEVETVPEDAAASAMTPYYADDWLTVYQGDAATVLRELPAESVHCVVTSPPYWGLRDYGVPGQLGLEPTPEAYVTAMVAVFREVRRVLRADGTVWLNMGDSYAGYHGNSKVPDEDAPSNKPGYIENMRGSSVGVGGLKPKDLVGMPWRLAFALQADGWYLRCDIIWAKPNPMPESVTDRPTKAHEYLFLLSKSPRYFYDAEAVREARDPAQIEWREKYAETIARWGQRREEGIAPGTNRNDGLATQANGSARNLRSVWTIATEPYPGAHFATFPRKLVEPCIKAGTSERGVCPECGAPWVRVVELGEVTATGGSATGARARNMAIVSPLGQNPKSGAFNTGTFEAHEHLTTGWRPSCAHAAEPVPAVVLDPFAGTGTVGLVAQSLSRRAILIDLSTDYMGQLLHRNRQAPLGLGA